MPIPEYKKLRSSFHNKEILTSVILKIFNCYNEIGLVPQGAIIPLSEIYDFAIFSNWNPSQSGMAPQVARYRQMELPV